VSPRRRSSAKRGWPAHLYEQDGYFTWRHPVTRESYGLGRDKVAAFTEAVEANLHLAKLGAAPRLIDRLTGNANRSVGAWLDLHWKILEARDPPLAANTLKSYRSLSKRTRDTFKPDTPIRSITPLLVADALDALAHMPRLAQAWRGFLKESFREAIVKGWLDNNPVRDTRAARVVVQRSRLLLPVFMQVYEACDTTWLRNAMALALVSAQRREDISQAKVKDCRERAWWVDQGKTGARVVLPFDLRLEAFGKSLGDVYEQCRQTGVLSPYLIHQTEAYGNSPPGRGIWKDTISRRFTDTLGRLGLDFDGKEPPTFHEIRSLSERLYAAQGNVNTQELLGHKDPRTTQLYHDSRGAEWVRVTIKGAGA
jgi:integrase